MAELGWVGMATFVVMKGVETVVDLPKRAVNALGFGYQNRFEIGGNTIIRPERFSAKPYRHAFDEIGRYILHPHVPDLMDRYFKRSFWKKDGISTRPYLTPIEYGQKYGVTFEVWDEVLRFFAEQGVIVRRWRLHLPLASGGYVCPDWDKEGNSPHRHDPHSGNTDLRDFHPGFMSEEEMNELIGKKYPKNYAEQLTGDKDDWILVLPSYFDPVYYRPREMAVPKSKS